MDNAQKVVPDNPRLVANDIHDSLLELLYIIHAMDCISHSNVSRGHAFNDLDSNATGWLAVLGYDRVEQMQDLIEQLRGFAYDKVAPDSSEPKKPQS